MKKKMEPSSPVSPLGSDDSDWSAQFAPEQRARMMIRTPGSVKSMTSSTSHFDRLYEYGKEATRRRRTSCGPSAEDQGCTFKPKIIARKSTSSCEGNRFDALYESGMKSRERLEERRKQQEAQSTPTFKPQVNKKKTPKEEDMCNRFEALYENAVKKRERLKEKERNSLDRECTFEPQTLTKKSTNGSTTTTGGNRLNDLYSHAKRKEERIKEMQEKQELQHTFKPRINKYKNGKQRPRDISSLCPQKAEIDRKREKMEQMKLSREMQGCTFAPKLSKQQQQQQEDEKKRRGNVHQRLYQNAKQIQQDRSPVSPTSQTSRPVTADSQVFQRLYKEGKEWSQRKAEKERLEQQRRESLEMEEIEKECTFRPAIDESSRRLAEDKRLHQDENIFARLYEEGNEKHIRREIDATDRLGLDIGCTFQPQINPTSKIIMQQREQQILMQKQIYQNHSVRHFTPQEKFLPNDQELDGLQGHDATEPHESCSEPTTTQQPLANPAIPPQHIETLLQQDMQQQADIQYRQESWKE